MVWGRKVRALLVYHGHHMLLSALRTSEHRTVHDALRTSEHRTVHDALRTSEHRTVHDALRTSEHRTVHDALRTPEHRTVHDALRTSEHRTVHDAAAAACSARASVRPNTNCDVMQSETRSPRLALRRAPCSVLFVCSVFCVHGSEEP